jgi:hypothetical protein
MCIYFGNLEKIKYKIVHRRKNSGKMKKRYYRVIGETRKNKFLKIVNGLMLHFNRKY